MLASRRSRVLSVVASFAVGALVTAGGQGTYAALSDSGDLHVAAHAGTWSSGCGASADDKPGNGVGDGSGNQGSDNGKGNGGCDNGYGKNGCDATGPGNGSCKSEPATIVKSDAASSSQSVTSSQQTAGPDPVTSKTSNPTAAADLAAPDAGASASPPAADPTPTATASAAAAATP